MNLLRFTSSLLFLGLLVVGCKKPPEACMELSSNAVASGTPIEFISCSKRSLSYEWFISGPESAPENNMGWSDPSFSRAFSVPGTYTVTLNAYYDFSFQGEMSSTEETFVIN